MKVEVKQVGRRERVEQGKRVNRASTRREGVCFKRYRYKDTVNKIVSVSTSVLRHKKRAFNCSWTDSCVPQYDQKYLNASDI